MKFFTKVLPIPLPDSSWKLLAMYLVVMNHRLLQRKKSQANLNKTIGAIVTQFLVQHEQWIQQEFYRVRSEVWRKPLPRFFSPEQLAQIESASAAQIPDAVRIGWRDRHGRAA